MRKPIEVYDFKAFGQAIKTARKTKDYTRKRLGKELVIVTDIVQGIQKTKKPEKWRHNSLRLFMPQYSNFCTINNGALWDFGST